MRIKLECTVEACSEGYRVRWYWPIQYWHSIQIIIANLFNTKLINIKNKKAKTGFIFRYKQIILNILVQTIFKSIQINFESSRTRKRWLQELKRVRIPLCRSTLSQVAQLTHTDRFNDTLICKCISKQVHSKIDFGTHSLTNFLSCVWYLNEKLGMLLGNSATCMDSQA